MISCDHHSGKHRQCPTCQTEPHFTYFNINMPYPAAMNIFSFSLLAAVCCCNGNCMEGSRPKVAKVLLERLFHGDDPMALFKPERFTDLHRSFVTHLSLKDVRLVLDAAEKPINFWLELGSFEGHSAIFASQGLLKYGLHASVVAVDTFLGDRFVHWHGRLTTNSSGDRRRSWSNQMRPDGTMTLFDSFKSHVRHTGMQSCILPIPATTMVGLKLLDGLAKERVIPRPQVIYLDSAHEEGEVLLELRTAWNVLAPGGMIFGDDWYLQGTCRDVLRFALQVQSQLDDVWPLSPKIQSLRRLGGRVRPGLFISHDTKLWFLKKRQIFLSGGDFVQKQQNLTLSSTRSGCWKGGFSPEFCCHESFGPRGIDACWDTVFDFNWCCNYGCT